MFVRAFKLIFITLLCVGRLESPIFAPASSDLSQCFFVSKTPSFSILLFDLKIKGVECAGAVSK